MYLHLGQTTVVRQSDIIGIFDLDNTTSSFRTRRFLEQAEQEGMIVVISEDLPKSFILCQSGEKNAIVYLSQLSAATLRGRAENNSFE